MKCLKQEEILLNQEQLPTLFFRLKVSSPASVDASNDKPNPFHHRLGTTSCNDNKFTLFFHVIISDTYVSVLHIFVCIYLYGI